MSSEPRFGFLKTILFSLLPALLLLITAEIAVRLLGIAEPSMRASPLPEERYGIVQADSELLWSLRPNVDTTVELRGLEPMVVRTNRLGLRDEEIGPKAPGEVRILSLGESTTFGAYVSNHRTYSALLESRLNESGTTSYRVINAGVSAWSSLQSLRFLEERGLALDPDIVLFYHELNDYLPTSLRGASPDETTLGQSDREIFESGRGWLGRQLIGRSALFRSIVYWRARQRARAFQALRPEESARNIGLPELGRGPQVTEVRDGVEIDAEIERNALPRRVPPEDRLHNLEALLEVCAANQIRLVIIHPAYRDSVVHECVLTEFCRARGVPMLEAYDVLHPPELTIADTYIDQAHPTNLGHERLANSLATFILALPAGDE